MKRRKLYRIPQRGKIRGVCAGIADYLGVPVRLVRVIAVISLFLGLFMFTLVAYLLMALMLEEMPQSEFDERQQPDALQLLDGVEQCIHADERRLREVERYVTSETFSVRSRFGQL